MNLNVVTFKKGERVYKKFVDEWFLENLKLLNKLKNLKNKNKLKSMEVSLVFVSKAKIKKLNTQFRGVPKATDVLSFDGDGFVSLGELIFCMDVVREKAKASKLPIKCYLVMLMTHGMLHLLGYEHEEGGADETEMFTLQNKIMRKVAAKLAHEHKTSFDVL